MSALISFDSLGYFERLKEAGVPDEQARVQVSVMQSVVQNYDESTRRELVTSANLADASASLKQEIAAVRSELKQDIADVRAELKQEIADLRGELNQEIAELRGELNQKIAELRSELKQDIANTRHEILKWVVGAALAQTAVLLSVIGLCAAFLLRHV